MVGFGQVLLAPPDRAHTSQLGEAPKSPHSAEHEPAALPAPGVRALHLGELGVGGPPGRPQIATRHLLALITAGYGSCAIDFRQYVCRPGTVLWIRPGQAHRLGTQAGLGAHRLGTPPGATVLVFDSHLLPGLPELTTILSDPFVPVCWHPTGEDADAIVSDVAQIAADCSRYGLGDRHASTLLRHQVAVLIVRLAALATGTDAGGEVVARYHWEIEASYTRTRRVEDYAERLGCSVRTLTRACLAHGGRSAKQVVDERVALAAKRLLACTDLPVAAVGYHLGFTEPTNFGRFFVRETGQSPGEFRAACDEAVGAVPAPRRSAD
jgi:AraC-like DNA-binding protein